MPDAPISETLSLDLGQWAEGANPGAAALNNNWEKVDAAQIMHGDEFPAEYQVGKLFLRDDEAAIYRNDGTQEVPTWTSILTIDDAKTYADSAVGAEAIARAAADDAEATARGDADTAEATARSDEDETFLKLDGSRAMTGDLDMGTHKIGGVQNAAASDEAPNYGQLLAAIAVGLGGLGDYSYCLSHNSADLSSGASPRTFEADTDDSDADAMHDTSSNKDRFVAPVDGYYLLKARMLVRGFDGAGIRWMKGDVEAVEGVQPKFSEPQGDGATFLIDDLIIQLDEGEHVSVDVVGMVEPDSGYIAANSSVAVFLLASNAPGGGDLRSDGTVPMTADFDNGAQKQTNMADGVADDDGATVGQTADLVDDAVAALDIPGQIEAALTGIRTLQKAEPPSAIGLFNTSAPHYPNFQDVTGANVNFSLPYAQRVRIVADGFCVDNGSDSVAGQFHIKIVDSDAAVTGHDGPAVYGGKDVNQAPLTALWTSGVLPAGSTTITLQFRNQIANSGRRVQVTTFYVEYFN
jgi:hypothetical protein